MRARLTLKIRPAARRTEFFGKHGDAWKLQVAAPPVDGKANEAIVRFLAKVTGLPASGIRVVTGLTGTIKIIEIEGIDSERLERAILESHGTRPDTGSAAPRKA